ncbi:isochorismate synthase MenF [Brucella sp. TWI432]
MRTSHLRTDVSEEQSNVNGERFFSFTSGNKQLCTRGLHREINTPAENGSDTNSVFQRTIKAALGEAQKNGQDNPVIVGAIPFNPAEPSCLFIPQSYEWHDLAPAVSVAAPRILKPTAQKSLPDEAGFKRAVEQAIANFRLSDVRKAVLSVMREITFEQDVDTEQMLANLRAQNREGYQFSLLLNDGAVLVGVSPELVIRKNGRNIISNPLAGSAKRMSDPLADQRNAQQLNHSEKDLYEHRLVIEDIAAHLQPVCDWLDVPTRPSLISTAALWHLSTRIHGTIADPSLTALQLACLLHPTPAVCGYPTERARRLIHFIEPFERRFFTGMVGWSDAQGNGEWVVTIRCGSVRRNIVQLFAGAGIVEASDPASEWNEVQTKLGTMLRACGLDN